MEVKVEDVAPNEIRVRVKGETYTLLTPIVEELNSREDVEFAGYDVPHPLKEEGLIFLRVKEGLDPRAILKDTIKSLMGEYDKLEESFKKELERFLSG